ncbi:unnamed protein product, partial [Ectocarpus sp. 12 AP-2014]
RQVDSTRASVAKVGRWAAADGERRAAAARLDLDGRSRGPS